MSTIDCNISNNSINTKYENSKCKYRPSNQKKGYKMNFNHFLIVIFLMFSLQTVKANSSNNDILGENYIYASLSKSAYDENLKKGDTFYVDGKIANVIKVDSDNSGFGAIAIQVDDKIIVAFRGTDSLGDVIDDAGLVMNNPVLISKQYDSALRFVNQINTNNKKINFTGHSLGGSIAQYAGIVYDKKTVTYNAAPISKLSFSFYNLDSDEISRRGNDIINIRQIGDPISEYFLGGVLSVGTDVEVETGACAKISQGCLHSIDELVTKSAKIKIETDATDLAHKQQEAKKLGIEKEQEREKKLLAIENELEETEQREQLVGEVKELVALEQSTQKTKLNEGVAEAKRLKKVNAKLSEEYQALYIKAEKNPNDKNLQQQLKAKKTELGNNAYAFLELEKSIIKNSKGYADFNGKPYSKGTKIVDENGNPIVVDGYTNAEKKAKNSVELVNFKIAEKERIKNEVIEKEKVAKVEQIKKVKKNIANWQLEKKAKKGKADRLLADLSKARKSGKKLDSAKVNRLKQLKKDISKLDKTIKIASSNIGLAIPVVGKIDTKKSVNTDLSKKRQELTSKANSQLKLVKKIQTKNQGLNKLNNQINSKRSEINSLEQQLAKLGGSSSSSKADRFKARSELIKLKMIKRIYDRYNGDITKISSSDRSKIKTLSNSLSGSWVQLFQNAPSRYTSAKIKDRNINLVSNNSSEAKAIQKKINKLKKQIATLSDTANSINDDRQTLISKFESSKQKLLALVDDINDENKENIGAEGGSDNGGGGTGGGNDGGRDTPNYLEGDISYIGFNATGDSFGTNSIKANGDYEFSPIENLHGNMLNNDIVITPSTPSESNPDIDGYKYTAWGSWSQSGLIAVINTGESFNLTNSGHYIIGKTTIDMPRTGTATYSGSLKGNYLNRNDDSVEVNVISGTIDITANFATSSVNANLNVNRNGSAWASVSTTASINNSSFSNDGNTNNVVVGGGNAAVNGVFYGTNAQEVGGSFWVNKQHGDGGAASGVFRAKQGSSGNPVNLVDNGPDI